MERAPSPFLARREETLPSSQRGGPVCVTVQAPATMAAMPRNIAWPVAGGDPTRPSLTHPAGRCWDCRRATTKGIISLPAQCVGMRHFFSSEGKVLTYLVQGHPSYVSGLGPDGEKSWHKFRPASGQDTWHANMHGMRAHSGSPSFSSQPLYPPPPPIDFALVMLLQSAQLFYAYNIVILRQGEETFSRNLLGRSS